MEFKNSFILRIIITSVIYNLAHILKILKMSINNSTVKKVAKLARIKIEKSEEEN